MDTSMTLDTMTTAKMTFPLAEVGDVLGDTASLFRSFEVEETAELDSIEALKKKAAAKMEEKQVNVRKMIKALMEQVDEAEIGLHAEEDRVQTLQAQVEEARERLEFLRAMRADALYYHISQMEFESDEKEAKEGNVWLGKVRRRLPLSGMHRVGPLDPSKNSLYFRVNQIWDSMP